MVGLLVSQEQKGECGEAEGQCLVAHQPESKNWHLKMFLVPGTLKEKDAVGAENGEFSLVTALASGLIVSEWLVWTLRCWSLWGQSDSLMMALKIPLETISHFWLNMSTSIHPYSPLLATTLSLHTHIHTNTPPEAHKICHGQAFSGKTPNKP